MFVCLVLFLTDYLSMDVTEGCLNHYEISENPFKVLGAVTMQSLWCIKFHQPFSLTMNDMHFVINENMIYTSQRIADITFIYF